MSLSVSSPGADPLGVVAGLTSAISRAADLSHIYTAALDGLCRGLGVERSSILLFDADGVMRFKAWRGISDTYRQAVEGHSPWRPDTTEASVLCTSDVRLEPALSPFLPIIEAERILAMAFVPLLSRGRVIGKLMCYYPAPHALTPVEATLAQTIADQVAFAVERTRNEEALVRNEERLRFALDAANMGTWEWDFHTNAVRWSDNLERVHGLAPGTFGGDFESYQREIHPEDRARVFESVSRAIQDGVAHDVEYRIVAPDGTVRWVEGKGRVEFGHDGRPMRMAGVCMVITRRKEAETGRAALVERATQLAEVSEILSRSLDYDTTLQSLAEFAVARLADWCIVDIVRDDQRIEAAGMAHVSPALLEQGRALRRRFPVDPDESFGPAAVIRSNRSLLAPEVRPEDIRRLPDASLTQALLPFDIGSAIVVPIRVGGRAVGAISLLASRASGRRYATSDLETAEQVAERAGAAIENARLYRAAQDANQLKDDFLATLSHELRTPLNAILGWSRMIERGVLPSDRTSHAIASIRRNAEAQTRLIGDILDIARIMSGKLHLDLQPVDLRDVISSAVDTLEADADARGVRLEVRCAPGVIVSGDPARLQQIVWNLVSNAVKFTPDGGLVRIDAGQDEEVGRLTIHDTGIGIDTAFLPRVFERFRQADASTTRNHSGLGLGLAITQHLVELHHGRVRAFSEGPGRGSTFTVEIPLCAAAVSEADTSEHARSRSDHARLATRHVLVVDDDPDSRQLLAMILSDAGARVDVAASAADAFERVTRQEYDLMVADIAMPGEDGFSLVCRIGAGLNGRRRLPAIAVTAHAREEDRTRSLAVGFAAHLPKPFEPERLVELAASVISQPSRA